jgi:hypothetical protein
MPLSAFAADTYVATGISEFTAAEIPDMSATHPESRHWIYNYILNSVLRGAVQSVEREYRFNFLRRAMTAFEEHALARQTTLEFVTSDRQSYSPYFAAIHHWEQYLAASWHALVTLAKIGGQKHVFEKGDGSWEERVNGLYNAMKHVESRIENGQMPPLGTLPVWLCNDGLSSTDAALSFAETGTVLQTVGDWAHILEDPITTAERLRELRDAT